MSWFNKAMDKTKDMVNQGIEDAKTSIANSIEDVKSEREEQAELRKIFKVTNRSKYLDIDTTNQLWRMFGDRTIYFFEDLVSYELIQDGDSIISGGFGVGRAIVGTIATGGVGALLGFTKKKKNKTYVNNMQIRITNKASKDTTSFITYIDKKTEEGSKNYRKAIQSAQETLGLLDIITNELEAK